MRAALFTDDRTLIEACIKKDAKAWNSLIDKYSGLADIAIAGRLKKYGFTLPRQDIEDIRQDVFAAIWRLDKLKSITNIDDISYWIAMVSGNAAINYIRKNDTMERLKTVSIHEKIWEDKEFADYLPSKSMKADEEVSEAETAKIIDSAIRKLPSREKLIIKLHLIHDKKYDDIADMLGLPKGTVSSYVRRAKKKLKTALKELF